MTKKGKKLSPLVHTSFDSLKRFYGITPFSATERVALPAVYVGAYSRRAVMSTFHVVGSSRDQIVHDSMRTLVPTTSTLDVADLYLEVAALVSLYYDTKEQLQILPEF